MARKIIGKEQAAANVIQREKEKREKILKAIPGSRGIVKNVAAKVTFHYNTVAEYFRDNQEAKLLLEAEREGMLDVAEDKLFTLVEMMDLKAIKFLLATKGKGRGYNYETNTNSAPVNISITFSKTTKTNRGKQK